MKQFFAALLVASLVSGCMVLPRSTSVSVAFVAGESQPKKGFKEYQVQGSPQKVYLKRRVSLSNKHIAAAQVQQGEQGPQIHIVFTDKGREQFAKLTRDNLNKPVAVIVDGNVISAPIIREEIPGGEAVIAGKFTVEEATRIANGIMGR